MLIKFIGKRLAPLKSALGAIIGLQAVTIVGLVAQTAYLERQIPYLDAQDIADRIHDAGVSDHYRAPAEILSSPDLNRLMPEIQTLHREVQEASSAASHAAEAAGEAVRSANSIQLSRLGCQGTTGQ